MPKTRFSLESGYNFRILGHQRLSCVLKDNLDPFWLHFGVVLGVKIGEVELREGSKVEFERCCQI